MNTYRVEVYDAEGDSILTEIVDAPTPEDAIIAAAGGHLTRRERAAHRRRMAQARRAGEMDAQ
jgi:hypothetical protein